MDKNLYNYGIHNIDVAQTLRRCNDLTTVLHALTVGHITVQEMQFGDCYPKLHRTQYWEYRPAINTNTVENPLAVLNRGRWAERVLSMLAQPETAEQDQVRQKAVWNSIKQVHDVAVRPYQQDRHDLDLAAEQYPAVKQARAQLNTLLALCGKKITV